MVERPMVEIKNENWTGSQNFEMLRYRLPMNSYAKSSMTLLSEVAARQSVSFHVTM